MFLLQIYHYLPICCPIWTDRFICFTLCRRHFLCVWSFFFTQVIFLYLHKLIYMYTCFLAVFLFIVFYNHYIPSEVYYLSALMSFFTVEFTILVLCVYTLDFRFLCCNWTVQMEFHCILNDNKDLFYSIVLLYMSNMSCVFVMCIF